MLPGVFSDYSAPIVRNARAGVRELAMLRHDMPSPAFALTAAIRAEPLYVAEFQFFCRCRETISGRIWRSAWIGAALSTPPGGVFGL